MSSWLNLKGLRQNFSNGHTMFISRMVHKKSVYVSLRGSISCFVEYRVGQAFNISGRTIIQISLGRKYNKFSTKILHITTALYNNTKLLSFKCVVSNSLVRSITLRVKKLHLWL